MQQCAYSKAAKDWMILEKQLFHRRGPWRDASRSLEPRWILDCYEGPSRMRRRIQHMDTRVATMQTKSEVESFRKLLQEVHNFCNSCWWLYRIRETLRLEKTFKIIESNLWQICASLSSGSHHLTPQYAVPSIKNPLKGSGFGGKKDCNVFNSNRMNFPLFLYKISSDRWQCNLSILFC